MIRLYSATASDFIQQCKTNQIATTIENNFFSVLGRKPGASEFISFQNSLPRMQNQLQDLGWKDAGVVIEYQMPSYGGRVDFMVFGKTKSGEDSGVIVELKQWQNAELSSVDSDKLLTWTGGGNREVLHPSAQALHYRDYLKNNLTPFYEEDPILLQACSYLHNYLPTNNDILVDTRFRDILTEVPCYTGKEDDYYSLQKFLAANIEVPDGGRALSRIAGGERRPSRKLMLHVSTTIRDSLSNRIIGEMLGGRTQDRSDDRTRDQDGYILLDDQIVVFEVVKGLARKLEMLSRKQIVLVHGGPGTGKSVLALQLLSELQKEGFNSEYATGSNSFTETVRRLVGGNNKQFFKYFMSFGDYEKDHLDVLVLDEAHRIREKTGYPFASTGRPQIVDILNSTKIAVFFIDDKQVVRPGEVGSSDRIRRTAEELGYDIHEISLKAQFRCAGSDAFINWVSDILGIEDTAHPMWVKDPNFDFQIIPDIHRLDAMVREKVSENFTARMMAGYCWDWTKDPDANGELLLDVQLGDYNRPWNAHNKAKNLRKGIPKSSFWAYESGGIDQVGCIYTAQGFEFDYSGVIFGNDLVYRFEEGRWIVIRENCKDPMVSREKDDDKLADYLKNTYRVLLTRAQRGCYVHFMDKETEKFVKSRLR